MLSLEYQVSSVRRLGINVIRTVFYMASEPTQFVQG